MYGKTLFLIDPGATVGGVAGGLADLDALGASSVELERSTVPTLELSLEKVAQIGVERGASLVVLGVSDPLAFSHAELSCRSALPDHQLLYLGVNSPAAEPSIPRTGRILEHVLVPGDFSLRSGCVAACLDQVARRGAQVVTLMHVADASLVSHCSYSAVGELGRVDIDWIERLKRSLLGAGVHEVRFVTPGVDAGVELDVVRPAVSLVLVGGTCNADIASSYTRAAARLLGHGTSIPALMLTAESCLVGARRGAA